MNNGHVKSGVGNMSTDPLKWISWSNVSNAFFKAPCSFLATKRLCFLA